MRAARSPRGARALAVAVVAGALATTAAARALRADGDGGERVIATVDGDAILARDLATRRTMLTGPEGAPDDRFVLESIIIERVIAHAVKRAGIAVAEPEVDAFSVETWAGMQKASPDATRGFASLDAFLEKRGIPREVYRESLRLQLAVRALLERQAAAAPGAGAGGIVRAGAATSASARDATLRRFLAKEAARYDGSKARASVILVAMREGDGPAETEARAAKIRAEAIAAGADFAAIAREKSDDPSARFTGGDTNFIARHGSVAEPIAAAAFAMDVGVVSEPVPTTRGFAIVKTTAKKPGKKLTLADIRKQAIDDWVATALRDVVGRWRADAKVEIK